MVRKIRAAVLQGLLIAASYYPSVSIPVYQLDVGLSQTGRKIDLAIGTIAARTRLLMAD